MALLIIEKVGTGENENEYYRYICMLIAAHMTQPS